MADFQSGIEKLGGLGTRVVALSVDSEEDARKTVARHKLTFPVLFGLDAQQVAARIGSYLNQNPVFIQPTGVILEPGGTVALVCYSSGPVGRLVAADTAGYIAYRQKAG